MLRKQNHSEIKTMNLQIFKAIVGSQAYGTSTPTSDIDYKGIFIEDADKYFGYGYREQVEINKDEMYFELRRFVTLAGTANPTVLELLFSPKDCVVVTSPQYELLFENRHRFVTKECANSFAGYAMQQIKKARGLDKKMNWEKARIERKTPVDFCYVYENGKTKPLSQWLSNNRYQQQHCGLTKLNHVKDCYALYYDWNKTFGNARGAIAERDYKGIIGDNSNDLRLSSIPKDAQPEVLLYFNKDGYSMHCKDYNEYQDWLKSRNTSRYVDSQTHGQKIDGKNLMHCKRLIEMAQEIAISGTIQIRRPNAAELLKIRRGEVSLDKLLEECEEQVHALDNLFASSNLPLGVDEEWAHELLLEIHKIK